VGKRSATHGKDSLSSINPEGVEQLNCQNNKVFLEVKVCDLKIKGPRKLDKIFYNHGEHWDSLGFV